MYGLLDGVAETPPTRSARTVLRELMSSLGAAGLTAAAAHPRLLASVDQHAAAIRDSLAPDRGPASVAALAGYAEGIQEAAAGHGWRPPAAPVDWTTDADWVLTRLLAICALARPLGIEPLRAPASRPAPEHEGPPPAR